jgi:hypothetical protein
MNEEMKKILAFLASSAMGCLKEPPIYGPLRLLDALERFIRYIRKYEPEGIGGLEQIADHINDAKLLCMTDREKFEQLVNSIGVEMVKIFDE